MTGPTMTPTEQALRDALKMCLAALQSQWSPYLRAGDKEAEAMKAASAALSLPAAEPMTPEQADAVEMSPEFTDTARAALLWVLWHHQGGSSPVGQPIRYALGMGAHDRLDDHQISEAKRWAPIAGSHTSDFRAHHGIGKGE